MPWYPQMTGKSNVLYRLPISSCDRTPKIFYPATHRAPPRYAPRRLAAFRHSATLSGAAGAAELRDTAPYTDHYPTKGSGRPASVLQRCECAPTARSSAVLRSRRRPAVAPPSECSRGIPAIEPVLPREPVLARRGVVLLLAELREGVDVSGDRVPELVRRDDEVAVQARVHAERGERGRHRAPRAKPTEHRFTRHNAANKNKRRDNNEHTLLGDRAPSASPRAPRRTSTLEPRLPNDPARFRDRRQHEAAVSRSSSHPIGQTRSFDLEPRPRAARYLGHGVVQHTRQDPDALLEVQPRRRVYAVQLRSTSVEGSGHRRFPWTPERTPTSSSNFDSRGAIQHARQDADALLELRAPTVKVRDAALPYRHRRARYKCRDASAAAPSSTPHWAQTSSNLKL
ncbi:hypothetical protein PYCCODRAFT_1425653 [Trametes coccinea BRFM310]|uniref:Uncharacterized protein n=1 Tax=Trametes coccinea (strain BRFM310) TaxID=1353009 RepID=A0A1Y2ILH1_TRAC3|nr:hypothetical protein PYCCODRAFT_1425653 [Trametes coccinea BRFM310]